MRWDEIEPADATKIVLAQPAHELPDEVTVRLDIEAPLNENGERCPWPWEPQQLAGAPLGQYHCPYCGAMVIAGVPHLDYRDLDGGPEPEPPNEREKFAEHYDVDAQELPPRLADGIVVFPPTVKQAGDPRGKEATWTLMPAPEGTCSQCATDHLPDQPHNAQSLHYQYTFYAEHDRWPTWADAMAHCTPEVRELWTKHLREHGVEI